MRKRLWNLACLLVALLVLTVPIGAEPLQQQSAVQITSPEMGAQVRGLVPIVGSASVSPFQFYKVEYGVGPSPSSWAVIGSLVESPVINGQLAMWDTNTVPDGVYTLRLQAVKTDGNFEEFVVRGVVVANSAPTSTPTPEATETPFGQERFTATPSPTRIQPTATPRIIAPEGPIAGATATPTLSLPSQRDPLIDTEGWDQAFILGAASMGIVFVLLGLVFAIRSLI
ncbi:MAG: hypothetical protein ACP5G7_07890 [Anaerolineae bacterium]